VPISEELAAIREDVAYIKAKIESLPDHETRLRTLERFRYAIPGVSVLSFIVAAITAAVALH
jgi:hypothetical protein